MKAIFAALLICLGFNAFAECAVSGPDSCVSDPTTPALASSASIIKTSVARTEVAALRAAPISARTEMLALRADMPGVPRRSTLPDSPPRAQAQPRIAEPAHHPAYGWGDSGLLLVGVALMTGIALRRYAAGPR